MEENHSRECETPVQKCGGKKEQVNLDRVAERSQNFQCLPISLVTYCGILSNGIISDFECNKVKPVMVLWVVWRESK